MEALALLDYFWRGQCTKVLGPTINDVIGWFKILNPYKMPSRQCGIKSWGVIKLETLYDHFGKEIFLGRRNMLP